ncbi:trans-resveratrol di-O-methyltransferase-like [Curcuma longa]|uniref:trans-resveratrol di-O-methyltransferase-like n=1 Tax=Curcuma longa TaxID=136217 RepID=UPI003D9F41EC
MSSSSSSSPDDGLWRVHTHVWNIMFNHAKSMALKCAVELGVADVLHAHGAAHSMTLSVLASQLAVPPCRTAALGRVMRLLVHSGIFTRTTASAEEEEAYALTPASATLLVKEKTECLSPTVFFALHPMILSPMHSLSQWLTDTAAAPAPSPFEQFHGKSIFELASENTELNRLFNEGMAADSRAVAKALVGDRGRHLFHGLRSLVDVGGGSGDLAVAIAAAFPQMKCAVFDLPHVVAGSELGTRATTVEAVAGDMFESIPPAQAVILKWILHDWNDENCVRILRNCKKAIPPGDEGGKAIIIEMVMKSEDGRSEEEVETQLLFDVHLLGVMEGKQRSEAEWASIFTAAGFTDYNITPLLGVRSIIQLFY